MATPDVSPLTEGVYRAFEGSRQSLRKIAELSRRRVENVDLWEGFSDRWDSMSLRSRTPLDQSWLDERSRVQSEIDLDERNNSQKGLKDRAKVLAKAAILKKKSSRAILGKAMEEFPNDWEQLISIGIDLLAQEDVLVAQAGARRTSLEEKVEPGIVSQTSTERNQAFDVWDENVLGRNPTSDEAYAALTDQGKMVVRDLASLVTSNFEIVKQTGRQEDLLRQMFESQRKARMAYLGGNLPSSDYLYYVNVYSQYTLMVEGSMSHESFKRLGTREAFMEFAKHRGAFGDYNETSRKEVDRQVQELLGANEFNTDQLRARFEKFKIWFRGWWTSELNDVMDTNPNSFISGLGQVVATLIIQGLETDRAIISVLGSFDTTNPDWKKLVGETIGQLQVMSAINNRELVYSQAKNISPEEVAKAMGGIAKKSAGRGESLGVSPDSWATLFGMEGVVEREVDTFGESFRKALVLYLARRFDFLEGDLTLEQLSACGVIVPDGIRRLASVDVYDPQTGYGFRTHTDKVTGVTTSGHVVVKNIFPLEQGDVHSADFIKEQRKRMALILEKSAGSVKAAILAERLAFKAVEAGYVGAQLDYLGTSKEAMYKLMHTRLYRYKYLLQQKEAGLPLSVEDIEIIALPYFDMIMLPSGKIEGTNSTRYISFKQYLLGLDRIAGRVDAKNIPIQNARDADLDYYFYDQVSIWGVKMWSYLIEGLKIPWHNVLLPGTPQHGLAFGTENENINPEHIHTLQEAYKYIGYWLAALTVEQANAFIQPYDERSAVRTWAWEARIPEGRYFNSEGKDRARTESEFQTEVARLVFKRMILRELQQYGSQYNDAIRIINPFVTKHGITLSPKDVDHIEHMLLVGVSKMNMVEELKTLDERFKPLFTEETVVIMLKAAGLIDARATFQQLLGVATQIATRFKLLEESRH